MTYSLLEHYTIKNIGIIIRYLYFTDVDCDHQKLILHLQDMSELYLKYFFLAIQV